MEFIRQNAFFFVMVLGAHYLDLKKWWQRWIYYVALTVFAAWKYSL